MSLDNHVIRRFAQSVGQLLGLRALFGLAAGGTGPTVNAIIAKAGAVYHIFLGSFIEFPPTDQFTGIEAPDLTGCNGAVC